MSRKLDWVIAFLLTACLLTTLVSVSKLRHIERGLQSVAIEIWHIQKGLELEFTSEEEALAPRFVPDPDGPYVPYLEALKSMPRDMEPPSGEWEIAYVSAVDMYYIEKGYIHLGVTTKSGEDLDLPIKGMESDLWYFVNEGVSFAKGIPIIAFQISKDKPYSLKDVKLLGYFEAEVVFDENGKPVLNDVSYRPVSP